MKSLIHLLALLPLLASSALAATTVKCNTELGVRPVNGRVPTWTRTITARRRPTSTRVIRRTKTKTVSETSTVTLIKTAVETTTLPAESDTFYSTSTTFPVETETITLTFKQTDVETVSASSTSTTQVVTTQGFQPIQDTVNRNPPAKRDIANPHADRSLAERQNVQRPGIGAFRYPREVQCTRTRRNTWTHTVYSTAPVVTKTLHFFRSTKTDKRTVTTTTTIVPDNVSVTLSFTETTTLTNFAMTMTTETVLSTTTTTEILPGPTVYDACNARNTFGSNFNAGGRSYYVSDIHNNGPGVDSNYRAVADGAATALECCNACFKYGTCETFTFRQRSQNCFIIYHAGQTCANQNQHPNYFMSKQGGDPGTGYVVGNGPCGFAYSGNSDASSFKVDR